MKTINAYLGLLAVTTLTFACSSGDDPLFGDDPSTDEVPADALPPGKEQPRPKDPARSQEPAPLDGEQPAATFALGGQVSGLAGAGLVLDGGPAGLASLDEDGVFTFPKRLASGIAYAIVIQSQPSSPTQTCVIASGEGAVGGSDVRDIAIECTTDRFYVGGDTAGLEGSGLALTLGDQVLSVDADGSFKFPETVESGQSVAIAVASQPTGPSQTCTVTAPTAVVGGENLTNVAVSCKTNTYTLGGTLSGLSEGEVVLHSSAGGDIRLSSDGSFTFETPIPSGTPFEVTVKTQPSELVCTVQNGSGKGTITDSDVKNVSVWCTDAVTFPSTASITPYGQPLGAGGGGAFFMSGASVEETFPRPVAATSLAVDLRMSDRTNGNCGGGPLSWNVLVNGTVVGNYSYNSGQGGEVPIQKTFTFASIAPIDGQFTLRIVATSTVCSGGGSWNWIAGGSARLR